MSKILIVDDEPDLCEILSFNFEAEGFEVQSSNSAEAALAIIPKFSPSLILLDVMMEQMSGYEMAEHLRAEGNQVPIIFLTALAAECDQLKGFGVGGDDYITKPFSFSTVLARVKAVLKRSEQGGQKNFDGGLVLDNETGKALLDGKDLELTRKEFQILRFLSEHQGLFFTREQIMSQVWDETLCVGDRSVDVHIARIRKKFGDKGKSIVSRTGYGYAFMPNGK